MKSTRHDASVKWKWASSMLALASMEAATEGSSEFEEASLASKRKQFQQANDKFAEAARMVGWGGVQREWGVCLMRWALWEIRVLQNKERLTLMKEQDKERERIRSLSFAYGTEGWDPHRREADFVTISLGESSAGLQQKREALAHRPHRAATTGDDTNNPTAGAGADVGLDGGAVASPSRVRSRTSAGVREEFDREPATPPKPQGGFLSSLLRRGSSVISSSLSSLAMAPTLPPPADIFEPYPPATTRHEVEELARRHEDRVLSTRGLRGGNRPPAGGAAVEETAYRERDFTKESEEMQIASTIESLFEQAYEKFSLGEKLYTEEMNRLSLLQEIEVKSGSSGEESGAYDYRRVPTDTAARSDDDNDDSAGYDDDHDVDVDGEQNQEGKERDEEPNEEEEETGEGEEVPGEAEALDNPAIQEEAAQTYEGSRERNANMEKFYCLLLAKWEHDDLLLEASADLTEQSPADLDAYEEDMRHAFSLYQTACHLFFRAYRCVNRSTEIAPEDEKRLMIQCITKWARSVDGMLTLKEVQPGVSGDHATEEGEGGFHEMVDLFLAAYSSRMMQYGMGEFTLGPLIAIALSKDPHAAQAGKQMKLSMIEEIRKGEEQTQREGILKELKKLPPDIVAEIQRNQLSQQEIVENYDIFRNALWFRTRIMLASPLASTISASVPPFGPSASFLPAFSARYKRVRLDSCRARRKQRMKRRREPPASAAAAEVEVKLLAENPKNRYTHWEVIGQGAFGEVFTAKSVTHPDERELRRGKAEIALMAKCRHPNIVSLVDAFHWNNTIWVAMEYCDGGTLRQFRQKADIDEPEIAYICREILKGLQYLHSRGQMHRDLKGENVLLNLSGEVKIADLGLAADAKTAAAAGIAGTPGFIAPEMIKRTGYDTKLDIWSFGCLVMEMVEGSAPYRELLPIKRLMRTAISGAPGLKDPEQYSKAFRHFLSCCLQTDPKLRYSAAQLLHHSFLEQAIGKERIVGLFSYIFVGETLELTGLM
ncbi:protein kinase domain containing protein [Acanthamoeba castellanii str. Neff]|uniref:Protein kinase domain containing protein n=1 Tax=Acanthamoeba castellanii (strain ATCC 30010 / Neff) TaxID=1257118 RepID=L8GTT7_ACACF|nr:protein kinase domain containing protein [Acanthamoeba castellanii str. Neff]ELR16018.1 protein kinase domain containing protein [Acanthamoeba castellanii str. Neff]